MSTVFNAPLLVDFAHLYNVRGSSIGESRSSDLSGSPLSRKAAKLLLIAGAIRGAHVRDSTGWTNHGSACLFPSLVSFKETESSTRKEAKPGPGLYAVHVSASIPEGLC